MTMNVAQTKQITNDSFIGCKVAIEWKYSCRTKTKCTLVNIHKRDEIFEAVRRHNFVKATQTSRTNNCEWKDNIMQSLHETQGPMIVNEIQKERNIMPSLTKYNTQPCAKNTLTMKQCGHILLYVNATNASGMGRSNQS